MGKIDQNLQALASRLKEIRERYQISQSELARRCGIDQGAISRTEACQTGPSWETLSKISNYLGIPLAALFSQDFETAICLDAIEKELALMHEFHLATATNIKQLSDKISAIRRKRPHESQ